MNTAKNFTFSSSLSKDYSIIGRELLQFESSKLGPQLAFRNFREAVVFVSISVLETYLEDLLDSSVSEERLCIAGVTPSSLHKNSIVGLSVVFALCVAIGFFTKLITLLPAALLLAAATLVVAYLCFLSPQGRLIRRMGFAKVLSKEIARRRGTDDEGRRPAKQILEDWFSRASGSGTLMGAAKVISPPKKIIFH